MERPTWKNTLYSGHNRHSLDGFATAARTLGYLYIEWNDRILSSDRNNGMHKIGTSVGLPVCAASELDQPGGVQWHGGLRPILQDIKSMVHDTLRKGTTLRDLVSGRLSKALTAVMLSNAGGAEVEISLVLSALDDTSLRGSDADGSIAAAVAALRVRVAGAVILCESMV